MIKKNILNLLKKINLREYKLLGKHYNFQGIEYDSAKVKEGNIFVAIIGHKQDGNLFVKEALKKGAVGIVSEKNIDEIFLNKIEKNNFLKNKFFLRVKNARYSLALLSSAYYDFPSKKLKVVGITGTNGKTTSAILVWEILKNANFSSAVLGTVINKFNNKNINFTSGISHTTPESLDLQKVFYDIVNLGGQAVAMEVSSHSLDLMRVKGVEFNVGAFTNLTQDHLDFHQTMNNYLKAKLKLFTEKYFKNFVAVINIDDNYSKYFLKQCNYKIYTYGIKSNADILASDINYSLKGTTFKLKYKNKIYFIKTCLKGEFNVYNILGAFSCGVALKINIEKIIKAIEEVKNIPGRMDSIKSKKGFLVIIDYAHTPDGLKNILLSAKKFTENKLITVFGCGGDRDKTKRPLMGNIAAKVADFTIITSDNPRTENPESIIKQIKDGYLKSGKKNNFLVEVDRKQAITKALSLAKKGDVVVVAGKGHEDYQIFKDKTIHFDDKEVCQEILKSL